MVAYCAKAAALEDPRFASDDCDRNSTALRLRFPCFRRSSKFHPEQIEPGKHGLMVSRGTGRRGVLLPQVAEEFGWTAERFLEETCVKAGLERDAWKQPDTRVQGFTAEVFSEAGLQRGARAARTCRAKLKTIRLRRNRPRKSREG